MSAKQANTFWKAYRFPLILIGSIGLGSILGALMGKGAMVFKPLGDLFLNALFIVVVPLVFTTICSAVASMSSMKRLKKVMGSMMLVFALTGILAAMLMLVVVTFFPPAQGATITLPQPETLSPLNSADQVVNALTVGDFPELISKQHMLPLILFTILFGISLQMLGDRAKPIVRTLSILADAMLQLVKLIMYYAPVGLAAYFATLVGDFGPKLLGAYARSMVVFHGAALLYFLVAFTIYAWFATQGKGVGVFWRNIVPPALTALGTGSSTATLPVNLAAAERMGIPPDIREMVLPIGATIHMEGSCLSGILKISFLFGIFHLPFMGLGTYASAILISVLGGVMLSGIPGGGLVGEMLIVNLYGFPPEAFPIIVTLGFLVDPVSTMINATGDTCSALMVSRMVEGKDWFWRQKESS